MSLQPKRERGFTLVELMVVVVIIGVLSALAIVGYRRYIDAAKISEAVHMAQSIRGAQESYRSEAMSYLNASASNTLYPAVPALNTKTAWDYPAHSDYANWKTLGVTSDGPVRFGYMVNAGAAGTAMQAITIPLTNKPTWPTTPADPWYVIQAQGKTHNDGSPDAVLIGSSLTGELYWEND